MSNSTIHNRYPDIAEKIRELVLGLNSESPPIESKSAKEQMKTFALLRKTIAKQKEDLDKSQSINLRLKKENDLLMAKLRGDAN